MPSEPDPSPPATDEEPRPLVERLWRLLIGQPRSLADRNLIHRLALVPFLAWVGLGADGLSSSSYGPDEAFRTLGTETYLAVVLAVLMAGTVLIISAAYRYIIEDFPHGGGGYLVATKLLGARAGLVSGAALLVDYVLTITVSIAAAGDALFSLMPMSAHAAKLPVCILLIAGLTTINIRGVRESVVMLTPIFALFVVTHLLLIVGGIGLHLPDFGGTAVGVADGFRHGLTTLGAGGLVLLLVHAYSLGGGTYTGIEAVSNGLPIMREPRVRTGKRTMVYMAVSLAFTASGLLVCYLLWHVTPVAGKTMNAVLAERVSSGFPGAAWMVSLTLVAEAALLVVAAQAGFLDGPRVLANMAVDSWVPRRFAGLSDRLTTGNGIMPTGAASLGALLYTRGDVRHLVVMYSINVFLTFSLSMLGMGIAWMSPAKRRRGWHRRVALFSVGFVMCATILGLTLHEKFHEGGWVTLASTGVVIMVCFVIRRHYRRTAEVLEKLYAQVGKLPRSSRVPAERIDPDKPVAAVLVGAFRGLGIHTSLNIFRVFPGHFQGLVFLSVGVIDSGAFKGEDTLDALRERTEETLQKYVDLAKRVGVAATYRAVIGTDTVDEATRLCLALLKEFPQTTFFAGKVIFRKERWYQKFLHNDTAFAVQKRLQWAGQTMVILPARVY